MSVQRYINSSFWSDDWVDSLSVQEKLIYMYLLTNESTSVAGVYKITIKRIKDDTGISREEVAAALNKFSEAKKAFYIHEYIVIPKWPKHQKLGERGTLKLGVNTVLKSLPQEIKDFIAIPGNYDYDTSFLTAGVDADIPHPDNDEKDDTPSGKQQKTGYPIQETVKNGIPHPENEEKQDTPCQKDDTPSDDSDLDLDLDSDLNLKHINSQKGSLNSEFQTPQKLFISLWQSNPDVFNTFAPIEFVDNWNRFWEQAKYTAEQIQTAITNYTTAVREGIIKAKFIPSTPDKFALKGWIGKSLQGYEHDKTAPPVKPVSKKSLGGLVV